MDDPSPERQNQEPERVVLGDLVRSIALEMASEHPELWMDAKRASAAAKIQHEKVLDAIKEYLSSRAVIAYAMSGDSQPEDFDEVSRHPENWYFSKADAERIFRNLCQLDMQLARQRDVKSAAGRYTLEDAGEAMEREGGERKETIIEKLKTAAQAMQLPMYRPGGLAQIVYSPEVPVRLFYEEAFWDDLNKWIAKYEPRIVYRFPDPHLRPSEPGAIPKSPVEWYDAPLDAQFWFDQKHVKPYEAALLLCECDPKKRQLMKPNCSRAARLDPTISND
jgi:hypothetical protein